MRFQDAAPDARAIVYAGVQSDPLVARAVDLLAGASLEQRVLARAAMNGETVDADGWRVMFPSLLGPDAEPSTRAASEAILAASLEVADRGEQVRSQFRGAIVESLTERLLRAGLPGRPQAAVRRERRVLFDGVRAEIHPYDVTVEIEGAFAAIDCKWGARGISADVLHQLDDARQHAADDDERLAVALVVFDAARSCAVRLARQTAPHDRTRIVALEDLDAIAGLVSTTPPAPPTSSPAR
ncbi:MAG TPA: hypothetical protein VFO05_03805 [Candidatus Limnocylindrales bacterium]|nr:hypothetical protein [Candidatus Limnocylindrales bacterium]